MEYLASCDLLTYQTDGWEDKLRRNLYGHAAAKMGDYPVILGLDNLTGERATAKNILVSMERVLKDMGLESGASFIGLTTDNPTTMQAFRRLAEKKFPWILVSVVQHVLQLLLTVFLDFCLLASRLQQHHRRHCQLR